MTRSYGIPLALALFATSAQAIDRLSLQVVCELAEERYRINLTDTQIDAIESDCSNQLADLLDDRIRFLEFVAVESRDNKLKVRIGKSAQEADPGAFRPVNIETWVEGGDVMERGEPVSWTFRTISQFLDIPAPNTFADAITLRFADELDRNQAQLVEVQLGRLVIADFAYALPEDKSWLLPFSRGELSVADNSIFKIKATLSIPPSTERFTYTVVLFGDFASAADVPPEFHNKVKALHLRDDKLDQAASIQRLGEAEDVQVLHVVVSRYVPISEPDRTSPSALELELD